MARGLPSLKRWQWALIKPGMTYAPERSITWESDGILISPVGPIWVIVPSVKLPRGSLSTKIVTSSCKTLSDRPSKRFAWVKARFCMISSFSSDSGIQFEEAAVFVRMLIFQAFLLRCDSPWAFPLRSLGGIVWDLQAAVKAKVTVGIAFAPFLLRFRMSTGESVRRGIGDCVVQDQRSSWARQDRLPKAKNVKRYLTLTGNNPIVIYGI